MSRTGSVRLNNGHPAGKPGDGLRRLRGAFWGGAIAYLVAELTGVCGALRTLAVDHPPVFQGLLFMTLVGVAMVVWPLVPRLMQKSRSRHEAVADTAAPVADERSGQAFVAHLNHELRTPLNAVTGFAGLIASTPSKSFDMARCQEYARQILVAGMELERLTADLVGQLAPHGSESGSTSDSGLDLAALLGEIHAALAPTAQAAAKKLFVTMRSGLEHMPIKGGREQLFALLGNLLQLLLNACPSGQAVRIVAFGLEEGDRVALRFILPGGAAVEDQLRRLLDTVRSLAGGHAWRASSADPLVKLLATRLDLAGATLRHEQAEGETATIITLYLPTVGRGRRQASRPGAKNGRTHDCGQLAALNI